MLTHIEYWILRKLFPRSIETHGVQQQPDRSKFEALMGRQAVQAVAGKVVVDFGCGEGADAIELARAGASRVIGLDIRESILETARRRAVAAGVDGVCVFAMATDVAADIVVSVDAFEHFEDPAAILRMMSAVLRPDGEALISFGPTWFHPLGGHLFSVFPWAHLIFSEKALIRWRATFKTDGATRFGEVAGGLNQITIRKFEALIANSPFRLASLDLVPVRPLRHFHNRLTREFTTALVRCRLVKAVN